ncbi:hypothetical protein TBCH5v1_1067 [Thermococcus barophilus]|uniref:Uncharacterized protein n=3 Tax=Thermococcus barophilus TaxID=55802 RepID=A0A0S1XB51_THEBA|nr:hypothetical protein TERMP_00882 [Thermococcus barophilus MP]ALM75009.1 hypothetical protein TBCH5v1_1067 [Thermococcus barophilus]
MKKGQSSLEYLIFIAVAIIIVALVIKYTEPAVKEVPITGIVYIDPETSPVVEQTSEKIKWKVTYYYPPGCQATKCDFYVSVNLKYYYSSDKYRIDVYIGGEADRIKKIKVSMCTGWEKVVDANGFDRNYFVGYFAKKELDPLFPCQVTVMAWIK